jgi:hypothetical protein
LETAGVLDRSAKKKKKKKKKVTLVRAKVSVSKTVEVLKQSDMYAWSLTAHSVTNAGGWLA